MYRLIFLTLSLFCVTLNAQEKKSQFDSFSSLGYLPQEGENNYSTYLKGNNTVADVGTKSKVRIATVKQATGKVGFSFTRGLTENTQLLMDIVTQFSGKSETTYTQAFLDSGSVNKTNTPTGLQEPFVGFKTILNDSGDQRLTIGAGIDFGIGNASETASRTGGTSYRIGLQHVMKIANFELSSFGLFLTTPTAKTEYSNYTSTDENASTFQITETVRVPLSDISNLFLGFTYASFASHTIKYSNGNQDLKYDSYTSGFLNIGYGYNFSEKSQLVSTLSLGGTTSAESNQTVIDQSANSSLSIALSWKP